MERCALIPAPAGHGEAAPWPGSAAGSAASAASENWFPARTGGNAGRGERGASAADAWKTVLIHWRRRTLRDRPALTSRAALTVSLLALTLLEKQSSKPFRPSGRRDVIANI